MIISPDDLCIADYARIIGVKDEEYISRGSDICYYIVDEERNVVNWVHQRNYLAIPGIYQGEDA